MGILWCCKESRSGDSCLAQPLWGSFPHRHAVCLADGDMWHWVTLQLNSPVPSPLCKPRDSCTWCRSTSFHPHVFLPWANRMKRVLSTASPISALLERFVKTDTFQNPRSHAKCLSPPLFGQHFASVLHTLGAVVTPMVCTAESRVWVELWVPLCSPGGVGTEPPCASLPAFMPAQFAVKSVQGKRETVPAFVILWVIGV